MLTNEEISKKIRDHLTQQKAQSLRYGGGLTTECAYRGIDGKMCAVGVLLADEDYNPVMESCGIGRCDSDPRWVLLRDALTARYGTHIDFCMLAEWQRYHDGSMYESWCDGSDHEYVVSPEQFHDRLKDGGQFQ